MVFTELLADNHAAESRDYEPDKFVGLYIEGWRLC